MPTPGARTVVRLAAGRARRGSRRQPPGRPRALGDRAGSHRDGSRLRRRRGPNPRRSTARSRGRRSWPARARECARSDEGHAGLGLRPRGARPRYEVRDVRTSVDDRTDRRRGRRARHDRDRAGLIARHRRVRHDHPDGLLDGRNGRSDRPSDRRTCRHGCRFVRRVRPDARRATGVGDRMNHLIVAGGGDPGTWAAMLRRPSRQAGRKRRRAPP